MQDTIFLLPGPTKIPVEVAEAMSKPMVNHRGERFKTIYEEIQQGSRPLFGTRETVIILPCSGTGAMESASVNLLEPGDKALVVVMGSFGQRFAEISRASGIDVTTYEVPWGEVPDPASLKDFVIDMQPKPKAVMVTHNETSTGCCLDLKAVAEALRPLGVFLIVDAVSSLGGIPVKMDDWGIDVVVTASQKALMTPPGLGLVGLSARALKASADNPRPRYYWDWRLYLRDSVKSQTPYTPALSQWYGLREALRLMANEGLENIYSRHRTMSLMARAGLKGLGATPLGEDKAASPTVTAFRMPEGVDADAVRKCLTDKYQVISGGGQGQLKGKVIRFGHMGAVTPDDVLEGLRRLGKALSESGAGVNVLEAISTARSAGGDTT